MGDLRDYYVKWNVRESKFFFKDCPPAECPYGQCEVQQQAGHSKLSGLLSASHHESSWFITPKSSLKHNPQGQGPAALVTHYRGLHTCGWSKYAANTRVGNKRIHWSFSFLKAAFFVPFMFMERNKGKCFIRGFFCCWLFCCFFHQRQHLVHLYVIYIQFLEAITLSVNLRWRKVNYGSCSIYAKTASDRWGLQKLLLSVLKCDQTREVILGGA